MKYKLDCSHTLRFPSLALPREFATFDEAVEWAQRQCKEPNLTLRDAESNAILWRHLESNPKENTVKYTTLLDLQTALMRYLSEANSSAQRRQALEDAIAEEWFFNDWESVGALVDVINRYLERNPRGFCDDGIKRFRTALGIEAPKPKRVTRTILVTLEIDVEGDPVPVSTGAAFTVNPESPLAKELEKQVVANDPWNAFTNANYLNQKFVGARVTDSRVKS